MDIDELLYDILEVINAGWVKGMSLDDGEEDGGVRSRVSDSLSRKLPNIGIPFSQ